MERYTKFINEKFTHNLQFLDKKLSCPDQTAVGISSGYGWQEIQRENAVSPVKARYTHNTIDLVQKRIRKGEDNAQLDTETIQKRHCKDTVNVMAKISFH